MTGAAFPQLQFSTVVDTPVFVQWLIPMVLTIEISQLQFDMVVFVPVVRIVRCAAMSCGGESFSPAGAYDYAWVNVKLMKGKYTINYIQYPLVVGCVCTLNDWICSIDDICADSHNYFQFKLKGKRRSAGSVTAQVQVCDSTLLR